MPLISLSRAVLRLGFGKRATAGQVSRPGLQLRRDMSLWTLATFGVAAALRHEPMVSRAPPAPTWQPTVILGGAGIGTDLQAPPKAAAIDAVGEKLPDQAVEEFFNQMVEYGGGYSYRIAQLLTWYIQDREANGWPSITKKSLSTKLVELGCDREQVDFRHLGEGRQTCLTFPAD